MTKFNLVKEKIADLEADAKAFYEKGNKSAGTRLRVGLQNVNKMVKAIREEVTSLKDSK